MSRPIQVGNRGQEIDRHWQTGGGDERKVGGGVEFERPHQGGDGGVGDKPPRARVRQSGENPKDPDGRLAVPMRYMDGGHQTLNPRGQESSSS